MVEEVRTAEVTDEDATYVTPSGFETENDKFSIRRARAVNSPEVKVYDEEGNTSGKVVPDIVNATERFRLERVAHVMLRHRSEPKDRIRAIMLLLESYEALDVNMAVKTVNMANRMMSMNSVDDADKIRIAGALRKLVIKPQVKSGPVRFEELNLKKEGQFIIEVDDE